MACTPCFLDGFGLGMSDIPYNEILFHFNKVTFPVSIFFRTIFLIARVSRASG
jgi:hypothetical protein